MADVSDYVIYCRLSRTLLCLCAAVVSSVSAFRAEVRDPKVSELRVHMLHSHDPEQIITEVILMQNTSFTTKYFGNFLWFSTNYFVLTNLRFLNY